MSGISKEIVDDIWATCNKDNDATMTWYEFKNGFNEWLKKNNKPVVQCDETLKVMFLGFDQDEGGDTLVTYDELHKQLCGSEARKPGILKDFKAADKDGGGLSVDEFREFVKGLGVLKDDTEIDEFVAANFKAADINNDGKLCLEDFEGFMNMQHLA